MKKSQSECPSYGTIYVVMALDPYATGDERPYMHMSTRSEADKYVNDHGPNLFSVVEYPIAFTAKDVDVVYDHLRDKKLRASGLAKLTPDEKKALGLV